ncbi:MAG TPA: RAQPRD family integrative conjugative element protein [Cellvibrionaceae bacterium]|nr:RAQPRD family integrative conjugative element protein [Cellvibrionaceae bacterium]
MKHINPVLQKWLPKLVVVGPLAAALLGPLPLVAQDTVTEIERSNLIAIARQLEQLHTLADNAQSAADPDARVKFNYTQLHRDIEQMRDAIARHLDKPSRTPRAVPSATSDYGQ